MRSPRVAIVFGSFPPTREGGADFMARFAPAVAELGVDAHVVTSVGGGPERPDREVRKTEALRRGPQVVPDAA